mmetsp:Transcript_10306/g.43880  ORF Transcript_10306/g.43880 Transcript_10306/m.43880 type:complete len:240 (+) Transcript_10306:916-1635(+)
MILMRVRLARRNPSAENVPLAIMRLAVGGEDGRVHDGCVHDFVHGPAIGQKIAVIHDLTDHILHGAHSALDAVIAPLRRVVRGDLAQSRRLDLRAARDPRREDMTKRFRRHLGFPPRVVCEDKFASAANKAVELDLQSFLFRRGGVAPRVVLLVLELGDLFVVHHLRDLGKQVAAAANPLNPHVTRDDRPPTKVLRDRRRGSSLRRFFGSEGDTLQQGDVAPRRRVLVLVILLLVVTRR